MIYKIEDEVVPMVLQGKKSCEIEVNVTNKTVELRIGPRDFVWDRKTGTNTDAGCWLGGEVSKVGKKVRK